MYNLPLNRRNPKDVQAVTECVGKVLEVEDCEDCDRSVQVRVSINTQKPLRRFQKVKNKEGKSITIELKFERLPIFCCGCEKTGHVIDQDCEEAEEEDGEVEKRWGPWLRASPRKGRAKMEEEAKKFLKAKRALHFNSSGGGKSKNGDKEVLKGWKDAMEVEEECKGDNNRGITVSGGEGKFGVVGPKVVGGVRHEKVTNEDGVEGYGSKEVSVNGVSTMEEEMSLTLGVMKGGGDEKGVVGVKVDDNAWLTFRMGKGDATPN